MGSETQLAVIIPASNEAMYIGPCLDAVLSQSDCPKMHVIVSANACTDRTVEIAQSYHDTLTTKGHKLTVLDAAQGGKTNALNRAHAQLSHQNIAAQSVIYLDADVICDPSLMREIATALDVDAPRYATGTLCVAPAKSAFTRAYARFWQTLPFVETGAVGAGFFALNDAGRKRCGPFPDIISDDTYVRVNFRPDERVEVPSKYHWPMIEGFAALTKVRRRQDAGVRQLHSLYPELMRNEAKAGLTAQGLLRRVLQNPLGFAAYVSVHFASRLKRDTPNWSRGR